jgi:hypothetical protein
MYAHILTWFSTTHENPLSILNINTLLITYYEIPSSNSIFLYKKFLDNYWYILYIIYFVLLITINKNQILSPV